MARQDGAGSSKIINDPIWGPIELNPLCMKIIDTPQFQRLRHIKQLGGCSFVYPGACHSRFEHSIGTAHLARMMGEELQKKDTDEKITDQEILCLEVAGLCHDLGHGPFSHVFDQQFQTKCKGNQEWTHEDISQKMLKEIFETLARSDVNEEEREIIMYKREFILELIKPPKENQNEKPYLYEIICNEVNKIDVDKWDYFSRDCHMLGLHHNFQCKRSIKRARIVENHISFPKSEYFNLFDMFYTRFSLHRKAYQHPVVKAVEMMIADAFSKADKCLMFPSKIPDEIYRSPGEKAEEKPNQSLEEETEEKSDHSPVEKPDQSPEEEAEEKPDQSPVEKPDQSPVEKPDRNEKIYWKSLSKSTEDMDAYLWVTDDVLQQIRRINKTTILNSHNLMELQHAQNIIDRIYRRDLYKLIGEKRVKWSKESVLAPNGSYRKEITNRLKEFSSTTFEIEEAVFHYGNGKKDPMSDVNFYHKKMSNGDKKEEKPSILYQPVNGKAMKENLEVSDMLPEKFQQTYIRLYWKVSKFDETESPQKIRNAFSEIKDVRVQVEENNEETSLTVKLADVKNYKDNENANNEN